MDLVVGQLVEEGAGRSVIVRDDEADNRMLGMPEETVVYSA